MADDGELLFRGGQVFAGYWHDDEATAEAKDANGWFHTGDVGEIDDEGFVRITGRKKEILVTAGGKNVAPAVLEDRLRAHPLVDQCIVVGDGQPFIAALVTIDPETLPDVGRAARQVRLDSPTWSTTPTCGPRSRQAVEEANKAVSKAESIRQVRDPARRVDRGGWSADPEPQAEAQRRACASTGMTSTPFTSDSRANVAQFRDDSRHFTYKTDYLRHSVSCRETPVVSRCHRESWSAIHALHGQEKGNRSWTAGKCCSLVAAVIAALGTLLVFLYVRGADTRADQRYDAVQVLRVVKPIAAGETVEAAQAAGKIESELGLQEGPAPRRAHRHRADRRQGGDQQHLPGRAVISAQVRCDRLRHERR